jgi:hypothetical protein
MNKALETTLSPATHLLRTAEQAEYYNKQEGFPYVVIDNFLADAEAEKVLSEFPAIDDLGWINYLHYNEKKYGLNKLDALPASIQVLINKLNSQDFLDFLSDLTGIKGLVADPLLEGGGLHQIPKDGFLNIHADFTAHPHHRNWRRRVNVLIYLNKDWKEEYGGHLELWTRDMKRMFKKVLPVFNRCVIFNTDPDAYHGHPDPLKCPVGMTRKSIALYYFTVEEAPPLKRATNYQARPGEGLLKNVLIFLDKKALVLYNHLKGILGFNDDTVSKILGWLSRKK